MTEGPSNQTTKTLKEKINEPIINAKKMVAIMFCILYEVITNLVYYFLMEDPNWLLILVNITIGIVVIIIIALLRAAYPEEVPDKTIWAALWSVWKYLVDAITEPKADNDTKMNIIEKGIQWFVREWDIAYQDKLAEQTAYYKAKLNEKIEAIEKNLKADT